MGHRERVRLRCEPEVRVKRSRWLYVAAGSLGFFTGIPAGVMFCLHPGLGKWALGSATGIVTASSAAIVTVIGNIWISRHDSRREHRETSAKVDQLTNGGLRRAVLEAIREHEASKVAD